MAHDHRLDLVLADMRVPLWYADAAAYREKISELEEPSCIQSVRLDKVSLQRIQE